MPSLSAFIDKSNEARTVDELYLLLEDTLRYECGFDRVIFSLMSDHSSLDLAAGHGIMRNYPDSWMKEYVAEGYEHVDPVRRFGFNNVGPFIWDQLPLVMDLSSKQKLCLERGREAGLYNGAAICLRGIMGEMAGIGCASSTPQGVQSARDLKMRLGLLNAISHQFYVAFTSLYVRHVDPSRSIFLTEKELEVIRLMAIAKSDSDMSCILNISPNTVKFHANNILRKFGVSNRISAVMKAVHNGILGPAEARFLRVTS